MKKIINKIKNIIVEAQTKYFVKVKYKDIKGYINDNYKIIDKPYFFNSLVEATAAKNQYAGFLWYIKNQNKHIKIYSITKPKYQWE